MQNFRLAFHSLRAKAALRDKTLRSTALGTLSSQNEQTITSIEHRNHTLISPTDNTGKPSLIHRRCDA